jgi:hypothetical protein
MSGIKELSEAVKFVCSVATAISDSMEDGKISVGDAAKILPLLYQLPSAMDGLSDVIDEVSDLGEDEIAQIEKIIKEDLDLPDDIESYISDAIDISLNLYYLIKRMRT